MNVLFENAIILGNEKANCLAVQNNKISYIGIGRPDSKVKYERVIDCKGMLLTNAFYNAHSHAPMTIFRGMGSDLSLRSWLDDCILPAEDRLTYDRVYHGCMLAIAEMIRRGVVSFSDMYFFCDAIANAVIDSGIKANVSRSLVSFDDKADLTRDPRINEAVSLYNEFNMAANGRLKVELAIHAEYSNTEPAVRYVAELAKKMGCAIQIHLSETEREHCECISRRGMSPAAFFEKCGVFDSLVNAAHCVYLTDEDISILASHGAVVAHNPISNLKLGSGIMPLAKYLNSGLTVALGTDGAASNNVLDVMREMHGALLLAKGTTCCPDCVDASTGWLLATKNGAIAQGRDDCGMLDVGYRADILLFNIHTPWNYPILDPYSTLAYSADSRDIVFTMSDGEILYEFGEYKTIDIERVMSNFKNMRERYFD